MRRVLVLLAVMVVAGLVAWLALRDGETRRPVDAPPAAVVPAAEEPAKAAPRKRARAGETEAATKPAPAEAPEPGSNRPAANPETIDPADSSGKLLVKGPDGPLAGVRVAFLEFDEANPPPGIEMDGPVDAGVAAVLERGRLLATGSDGRTALPKFPERAVVAARHGERVGINWLVADDKDWTLELARAVSIDADVRDSAGKPCADVGVVLLNEWDDGSFVARAVRTDAGGRAHFAHLDAGDLDEDARCVLTVALPLAVAPRVVIDVAKPPKEPVTLTLPAAGRLRCEVVDEGGRPAPDGFVVLLRRAAAENLDADNEDADDDNDGVARASVSGGLAMFPYVGVGTELEAELRSVLGTHATVRRRVQGPTAAGEEAVVRLVLGDQRPVVVGRLVGPSGAPVAGAVLFAYVVEPGDEEWRAQQIGPHGTTDAEGRFRLELDRAANASPRAKMWLVRDGGDSGAQTRSIALLELPSRAASGEMSVGDVADRGAALLAAGVVVDASGKPVTGARVQVTEVSDSDRTVPGSGRFRVTTDAEGRFRIEGASSSSWLSMGVAIQGWYLAEPPKFAPGREDLRVALARAGGIAGSIRVPDGVAPSEVRIVVSGEPSRNGGIGYDGDDRLSSWVDRNGSFAFPSLRPGKAKVSVRMGWNEEDTLAVVQDVEVVAGQVTRDPRLQGLDLAKSLRAIRVSAVDPDGSPVADATAHWRAAGNDDFWRDVGCGKDGVATIPALTRGGKPARIDVVVKCRGYRSAPLSAIESDATVTLRPSRPVVVRVRLADATALPEPPFHLSPDLAWIATGTASEDDDWGDSDPRDTDRDARFGNDRVVVFEVADPGRYRVMLLLWEMEPNRGRGSPLATSPKRVLVDVPENATGPIEVVVGADPEELAEQTERPTER